MVGQADALLGELDYPMVIVTAADGERRAGCLVGFHTQCSIEPIRYLVCISQANATHDVALRAGVLVVHLLVQADLPLARLFGEETGDEIDKFTRCDWTPDAHGVPVLHVSGGWFAGPVIDRMALGDHTGFVVAPAESSGAMASPQLGFQQAKGLEPGHPAD